MPLRVHFLNVGRGDCTIIEFPGGRVGMVDLDNLKALDDDTLQEVAEEYMETLEFQIAKAGGRDTRSLLADFIRKEEERLTDPLAYYDANIGAQKPIFRLVVTHPDMDHMTGLYRVHEQDATKEIVNFWHSGPHDFNFADTSDADWEKSPYDRRDWETESLRLFRRLI